ATCLLKMGNGHAMDSRFFSPGVMPRAGHPCIASSGMVLACRNTPREAAWSSASSGARQTSAYLTGGQGICILNLRAQTQTHCPIRVSYLLPPPLARPFSIYLVL